MEGCFNVTRDTKRTEDMKDIYGAKSKKFIFSCASSKI
jgi:hypothetical protein